MKRIKLSIILLVLTVSVKAQTTFNIRGALGYGEKDDYSQYNYPVFLSGICAQSNITLGSRTCKWTFSPTLFLAVDIEGTFNAAAPLLFGYKVPISNGCLFIPKIGPAFGYYVDSGTFILGPSAEFAFEIKHFIVSANSYFGLYDGFYPYAFLTFGYKF